MSRWLKDRASMSMAGMDELPRELKELVWRYGRLRMVLYLHERNQSVEAIEAVLKAAAIDEYLQQMEVWRGGS